MKALAGDPIFISHLHLCSSLLFCSGPSDCGALIIRRLARRGHPLFLGIYSPDEKFAPVVSLSFWPIFFLPSPRRSSPFHPLNHSVFRELVGGALLPFECLSFECVPLSFVPRAGSFDPLSIELVAPFAFEEHQPARPEFLIS